MGSRGFVGFGAAAGALLAWGLSPYGVPQARADFDDLITPIIDALAGGANAVDPGLGADAPLGGVEPFTALTDWWDTSTIGTDIDHLLGDVTGQSDSLTTETTQATLASSATGEPANSAIPDDAVPLQMGSFSGAHGEETIPIVNLSAGNGSTPVEVDTGSNGIVLPLSDVPFFSLFGHNDGFATSEYLGGGPSGQLNIFYEKVPETVSFIENDGSVVQEQTDVDVVLFSWPQYWSFDPGSVWSFGQMMQDNLGNANGGILGIGSSAVGPDQATSPLAALPDGLGQGVLINEGGGAPGAGYLEFGPPPEGLGQGVSVDDIDDTAAEISIDGAPPVPIDNAYFDTGGGYGDVSENLVDTATNPVGTQLPAGTTIELFNSEGTPLYSYTVGDLTPPGQSALPDPLQLFGTGPTVLDPSTLKSPVDYISGYGAFYDTPVYIDNSTGAATFFPPPGGVSGS